MPEQHLPIDRLREHPANVREDLGDLEELAASIRSHGILQPVVVQPNPDPAEPGTFLILAGHRRTAAAQLAGIRSVPVIVRAAAGPKAIEIMLIENCQRRDLGPMEKAEAMGKLRRRGMSGADISRAIGLTSATVSYYLSLLDLDDSSQQLVRDGRVSAADAVGVVRATRRRARPDRRDARPKVGIAAAHFSYAHPLADKARLRCQLAGHEAEKYGRDRAGYKSKVACGQCWEYVIRADERGEDLPADQPPPGARKERMRVIAALPMHDSNDPVAQGRVTAGQAAERLGVTRRTIERYKADLATAGAS
jgi:ParB family chromosome partitioning protein